MPDVILMMGWGLYGKLPVTGDFVRYGLPSGFVDAWDRWLQREIAAAQQTMAARWQACYMSAPIWRFSLAAGVAGDQAMLGILMASVDRVGRQFPLTLATPIEGAHNARHLNARALFEALEDVALGALDDLPLAVLRARLGNIGLPAAPGGIDIVGGLGMARAEDIAAAIAAPYLGAQMLWSAHCDGGMRIMQGATLPSGERFAALFDLNAPAWTTAR